MMAGSSGQYTQYHNKLFSTPSTITIHHYNRYSIYLVKHHSYLELGNIVILTNDILPSKISQYLHFFEVRDDTERIKCYFEMH